MFSKAYLKLLDDQRELHVHKSAGYSGKDNPDPWANFRRCEDFGVPAYMGCLIRLSDKYQRVISLLKCAENDQVNESLRDTLMDLSAYAMITICLYEEYCERKSSTDDSREPTDDKLPDSPPSFTV